MDRFEGYVGIGLWEGQWVDDVIFSLLFLLFVAFAIVFRRYYRLFPRLVKDSFSIKKRVSLFEETAGNDASLQFFLLFQAILLTTIGIFVYVRKAGLIAVTNGVDALWMLFLLLLVLFVYYGLKQFFYVITGSIFADEESKTLWRTGYNAVIGLWGISLYVPISLLLLADIPFSVSVILSLFLYILSRFVIIYKTIRVFPLKKDGFLYFSLYLCGQEIMPLFLLYKGIVHLYNFI